MGSLYLSLRFLLWLKLIEFDIILIGFSLHKIRIGTFIFKINILIVCVQEVQGSIGFEYVSSKKQADVRNPKPYLSKFLNIL